MKGVDNTDFRAMDLDIIEVYRMFARIRTSAEHWCAALRLLAREHLARNTRARKPSPPCSPDGAQLLIIRLALHPTWLRADAQVLAGDPTHA